MPCIFEPRQEALRPPLSVSPPYGMLGLSGGHSAHIRGLHLILRSSEFMLGVCELAGQVIEPGTKLFDQCLGGRQLRPQSGDFILPVRALSVAMLNLVDNMWPINLIAD
jgi:hypothetical protein